MQHSYFIEKRILFTLNIGFVLLQLEIATVTQSYICVLEDGVCNPCTLYFKGIMNIK